jgi:transposase
MADEKTKELKLGRGGRMSVQRKREAVLRLLRGEDLEIVSRQLGVTAATLWSWREAFLSGGEGNLKSRPDDGQDELVRRLEAKLGQTLMDNELLREKIARMEGGQPLGRRRPRR